MAKEIINVGLVANDDTGDKNRDGWIKANSNFDELYAKDADLEANKVAKVVDKELSENDYVDADKAKVDNLPTDTITEIAQLNAKLPATVATVGADYLTFKDAYDDGVRDITHIGNSVEVAFSVINESVKLTIENGVVADFSAFNITVSANNVNLSKVGGGKVKYNSNVVSKPFFDQSSFSDCSFSFNGGEFLSESTQTGCYITDSDKQTLENFTLKLPDLNDCGIFFQGSGGLNGDQSTSLADNLIIIGGGINCYNGLVYENGTIRRIIFNGVFDTSSSSNPILKQSSFYGILDDVYIDVGVAIPWLSFKGEFHNNIRSAYYYKIFFSDNNNYLSNLFMAGSGSEINFNGKDNNYLTNIFFTKITSGGFSGNNVFTNCDINSLSSPIEFQKSTFENCRVGSGSLEISGFQLILQSLIMGNGNIIVTGDKNTLNSCESNNIIIGYTKVDPTIPPPTEVLDDKYFLGSTDEFPGSIHGDWDGSTRETTPKFDGALWAGDFTPNNTTLIANRTNLGTITDNGNNTQELLTSIK